MAESRESVDAMFGTVPAPENSAEQEPTTASKESIDAIFDAKPKRSNTEEFLHQAAAGPVVDIPKMAGESLQYFSPKGSPAEQYGKEMAENAEKRAPEYEPDTEGRGEIAKTLQAGVRSVGPSLATMAPAAIPLVGPALSVATTGLLFGGSAAKESKDKVLAATGDPEAAKKAGYISGLSQSAGEYAQRALGLNVLGAGAKAIGAGVKGGIKAATDSAVVKPFLKSWGAELVGEPATETAQDVATQAAEEHYGAPKQPYGPNMAQSARGGFGAALLMGPLGLGGHAVNARMAQNRAKALDDPNTPEAARKLVVNQIHANLTQTGVPETEANAWREGAFQDIAAKIPVRKDVAPDPVDAAKQAEKDQLGTGPISRAAGTAIDNGLTPASKPPEPTPEARSSEFAESGDKTPENPTINVPPDGFTQEKTTEQP